MKSFITPLFALGLPCAAFAQAQISALPQATGSLTGVEPVAIVQGAITKQATAQQIANTVTAIASGATLGTPTSIMLTHGTGLPLATGVTGTLPITNLPIGTSGSTIPLLSGANTWGASQTFTAPIVATPTIIWSGSGQGSSALASIWDQETLSGTSTASPYSFLWANQISIADNLNVGNNANTVLNGLDVQDIIAASAQGSRNAIHGGVYINTKPSDPAVFTGVPSYVGVFPTAAISVNLGGTGLTYGASAGSVTASNPNVTCATGATFLAGCNGEETDVTALTGSSFSEKYGDTVIQPSNSVVQGTMDDAAYLISNASGAAGWKTGFSIGNHAAYWPIDPMNGILIAAFKGQSATAAAYEGVDFTAVTFSTAALKIQGYTLDQYGRGYSSSPSIAAQTGTPTLSSCGTSPVIIGSDRAGTVTVGAGSPTSCTLTFAHAWNGGAAPHCVFTARATVAGSVAITADSATTETVALSSAFPSFTYMCED